MACSTARASLRNPVFELAGVRVRDPAVRLVAAANGTVRYELYYTHYEGEPKRMWTSTEGYTVRVVTTADWSTFSPPAPVTPHGFVSPDAPVTWRGATILAYQAYPDKALGGPRSGLFFSRLRPSRTRGAAAASNGGVEAADGSGAGWSAPRPFLQEALSLPWNDAHRAIDPTLVVGPDDTLHCFFVGSTLLPPRANERKRRRANLLGHAVTDDARLQSWRVLTSAQPMLGVSARAADGVENVAVFARADGTFTMIYSEGLEAQHLAHATSADLYAWEDRGPLQLLPPAAARAAPAQQWMVGRYGAPFVWREASGCYTMALMGEYEVATHRSAVGLLVSEDGERWELLMERHKAGHARSRHM